MNDSVNQDAGTKKSWWQRLSTGLKRTSASIGGAIADLVTKRKLDAGTIEELEELLIRADLGVATSAKIAAAVAEGRYDKTVTADEVKQILADPDMIKFEAKARACILNAREFKEVVKKYGSFHDYVDSFQAQQNSENWLRLKNDLRARFSRMGLISPYHFMMDIGLPVMKPDIVVSRIFYRLGLIPREKIGNDSDAEAVVRQGEQFAAATGHSIRYIDIVFVCYGQVKSVDIGLERGICLGDKFKPRCEVCQVTDECEYFKKHRTAKPTKG